jgi:hypothetical protein
MKASSTVISRGVHCGICCGICCGNRCGICRGICRGIGSVILLAVVALARRCHDPLFIVALTLRVVNLARHFFYATTIGGFCSLNCTTLTLRCDI